MNISTFLTLPRTAPGTSRELELEVHIANELAAAYLMRALTQDYIAKVAAIPSTMGWLRGHDKEDVLMLARDFLPPDDATVERWAADNFVSGEEE